MHPPFQELSAVIKLKLTLSLSLLRMYLQFLQGDFKSEYLFRTYFVGTNPVTSLNIPFRFAALLCCVAFANYGAVPYLLISFVSAALLQAVLQANTERFLNALVKMRDQIVERRNGLRTSLVPVQTVFSWSTVSSHVLLNMKSSFILYQFDEFNHNFPIMGSLPIFVYISIYCVDAGTSILVSVSGALFPYSFHRKVEKTRS